MREGDWRTPAQATRTQVISDEDLELIRLVASGYRNNQIAEQLGIDASQLEEKRALLAASLNLRSRIDMIRFARANNLIDAG